MTDLVYSSNIHVQQLDHVVLKADNSEENQKALRGIGQHLSSTTLIGDLDLESAPIAIGSMLPLIEREKLIDLNDSSCTFLERSSSHETLELDMKSQLGEPKPMDTVILPENSFSVEAKRVQNDTRHGISRYAPYGTRFAAKMKDGSVRTSHVAGDLANRARIKNGRGSRVDLVLATHQGERFQLDAALEFYQLALGRSSHPGPSEVLSHLKDLEMDWDYRKGEGIKLLQRNASNFFKRMMEHAKRSLN